MACVSLRRKKFTLAEERVTPEVKKTAVLRRVEEDRDLRRLLRYELWDESFQLREAANGDEGLIAVMEAVPDVIVTDLKMPAGGNRLCQSPPDIRAPLP